MAKLRIDSRRQRLFEPFDSFRHFAETVRVAFGIPTTFFIGNNAETLAECGGELA